MNEALASRVAYTLSFLYRGMQALVRGVRLPVAALILVVSVLALVARQLGLHTEDVQIVLFPLFCVLIFLLPSNVSFRLPLSLVLLAAAMWAASTLHLRVLLPRSYAQQDAFVVSRLKKDENSVFVRQILKRYATVARAYDLPSGHLIPRTFVGRQQARAWLSGEHPRQLFVLRGYQSWLEVVLNPQLQLSKNAIVEERTFLSPSTGTGTGTGSPRKELVEEFSIPWIPQPLLLASYPEVLDSPSEPREFAVHALGWLAEAIRAGREALSLREPSEVAAMRAVQRDALAQLYANASVGLSNGMAGVGQYLLASYEILEFRAQNYTGEERITRAIELLRDAATYAKMKEDPELFSMIFNNAGVAMFAIAETEEELYKAEFWLRVAHDASAFGEEVPFGAELALKNLLRLEQARTY